MKTQVHLSKGVQDETNIQDETVEANLQHVRVEKGHTVADVSLSHHEYLARQVAALGDDHWFVDRLKRVY